MFVASVHAVAREATRAQLGDLDPVAAARPSAGRARVNDVVFARLAELVRDRQFIIAGDWNTARLFGSSYPGTAGAEFFARARERGWFECVLEKRGEEVQTWFRAGDRPYQLDHAFCDPALGNRLQTVRLATEAAADLGLSDHAPPILNFEVAPISVTGLTEQADRPT